MNDSTANLPQLLRAAAPGQRRHIDAPIRAVYGDLRWVASAEALPMGRRSVDRRWATARTWLAFRLEHDPAGAGDE